MTRFLRIAPFLAVLAAAYGFAQSPPETAGEAPPEPDVRLVYESDTRAYYRPCG